jgi:hypothetical protein
MAEHKGLIEASGLSLDAYHFYSRTQFEAGRTARALYEAGKRPKRHNKGIERAALRFALDLEIDCRKALEPAHASLLLPPAADAETRYELQAGIRVVHAILPFTLAERDALRPADVMANPRFEDKQAIAEPSLVERWHEWLWMDPRGEPQTSVEALGASAILAEGCARLSHVLPRILHWDGAS